METEGVTLEFTDDAIEALAAYAFKVNQSTQNIGARRLYTILERLLEELSFEAPDMKMGRVDHQRRLCERTVGRGHRRRRSQQVHPVS